MKISLSGEKISLLGKNISFPGRTTSLSGRTTSLSGRTTSLSGRTTSPLGEPEYLLNVRTCSVAVGIKQYWRLKDSLIRQFYPLHLCGRQYAKPSSS
jgi:hypothetical protein